MLPEEPRGIGGRETGFQAELGQQITLALLRRPDDLDEQLFLGAEVVDQHAVADADRVAQAAQAQVREAVCRDVVNGHVHQMSAPAPVRARRALALGM